MTLENIPQLPKDFFHKEIDSLHVITHPTRPAWVVVNSFGWEILKLCDGVNSTQNIVNYIKSQYDVSNKTAVNDVATFIASIEKTGVLINGKTSDILPEISLQSLFFHLTDKCNLQCKHCYVKNMSEGKAEVSDKEMVSFIESFYAAGGKGLVLSGGEPLLRKNFKRIFEINPAAHYSILTNATLINDEYALFLSKFRVAIQVSIDGSTAAVHDSIRGEGAFNAAIAGIECLKKRGLLSKLNTSTTIMKQNINDLPNILKLASSLGIPLVRFLPLRKRGNAQINWQEVQGELTARDYELFYKYVYEKAILQYPDLDIRCGISGYILNPKKLMDNGHWCPIGKNVVIDTKGNVYPCSLLIGEKFRLGNIAKNSIEEIKSHPVMQDLIAALSTRKNKIEKCRSCMWKNFCQSSCMGAAYDKQGTIYDTGDFCDFRIKLYEQSVIKLANLKSSATPQIPCGDTSTECF